MARVAPSKVISVLQGDSDRMSIRPGSRVHDYRNVGQHDVVASLYAPVFADGGERA